MYTLYNQEDNESIYNKKNVFNNKTKQYLMQNQ